jgi:peptidyl-tRNA hydrolase
MQKIEQDNPTEYGQKLYVIVDSKIKMPNGKLSREVAGAVTKVIMNHWTSWQITKILSWYKCGFPTIVLKTDDIQALINVLEKENIKYFEMIDAGKTVFHDIPTRTCIGITLLKHNELPEHIRKLKLL